VRSSRGVAGYYQLQAHLAACHSTAATWQDTNWDRIIGLYDLPLRVSANPAVALNRAVALGERDGPAAGLAALDAVSGLSGSHLWHAARAEALRRLGHGQEAQEELRRAAELAPTGPEQRLLARRLVALASHVGRTDNEQPG
jgi:predicted RNA polymerase sigma factor